MIDKDSCGVVLHFLCLLDRNRYIAMCYIFI